MSNTLYADLRAQLKTAFASITVANGYANNLDAAKFRNVYDPNAQKVELPAAYPKLFFLIDECAVQGLVSKRVRKELYFTVILCTLQDNRVNTVDANDQLLSIIDDVEVCLARNYSMGGLAISSQLRNFKVDSGVSHPEGCALLDILIVFDCVYGG